MRNTIQKELVFTIVNNSYAHLSAQEIYLEAKKTIKNISLGTVYRILNDLANNHKILRIKTRSGIDHFDRIPEERHHHFICNNCGKIIDVFNAKYLYDENELKNYQITNVDITFTGLCNECKKGWI